MTVCEQFSDRIASERVLEIVSKFGVSIRNVFFLAGSLSQRVDDITKHMKRTVYVAPLSETLALNISMLDPLAACQVDYMNFRFLGFYCVLFCQLTLH